MPLRFDRQARIYLTRIIRHEDNHRVTFLKLYQEILLEIFLISITFYSEKFGDLMWSGKILSEVQVRKQILVTLS